MWHAGDGMGWWMTFGVLLWLLMWGAFIYVIVKLSGSGSATSARSTRDEPFEIARRRYAAGEISKAQYEELRRDLMSPTT